MEKFDLLFKSRKDNLVNPYIDNYRSYELDYTKINNKQIKISFSKFGLLTINNSALKQSIEIVRRRIDDVGTKEPTILQRGEKRILVELPGLKDPERIKKLLGKTAQLNFRLVSDNDEFGIDNLISETGEELKDEVALGPPINILVNSDTALTKQGLLYLTHCEKNLTVFTSCPS